MAQTKFYKCEDVLTNMSFKTNVILVICPLRQICHLRQIYRV